MRLLILVASLTAACLIASCGDEVRSTGLGGAESPTSKCINRLPDDRGGGPALGRDELLRRFAGVRALQSGDYTAYVSDTVQRGSSISVDQDVFLGASYYRGLVAWRRGETTITAISHTASPARVRDVLRCGEFAVAARTAQGTVWRPRSDRTRVVVERRGVLIGAMRTPLALVREVASALGTAPTANVPAGWNALRAASGPAAALARERRSCARFQVFDAVSSRRARLTVGLPAGERLRLRDVRVPRDPTAYLGVELDGLRRSQNTATVRVKIPQALRAAAHFGGAPPYPAEPWRIICR